MNLGNNIMSAGRGALLLTGLSALSQMLGFGYRVVLSRLVGAEIMGLYQLVMPVYSVLLSVTAAGLAAAVSNLTSQHLALGNRRGAHQTIRACLGLLFLLLLPVGLVVIPASDFLSVSLLGDARTQLGLILLLPCVALTGVENLHKQYFYGAGRVTPPAVVELLEQLIRTAAVLGLLLLFLPQYPERVVGLIVAGMVVCEVFSSLTLVFLYRRELKRRPLSGPGEVRQVRWRRIASIALPVGANALLGNLLGAVNATLIPQKLVEGGLAREAAVAQFGVICGMTMPMLALPTLFLGPLNLILVPRLSRAYALNQGERVRQLAGRALWMVSLLTLPAMAVMTVLGPDLGLLLFHQAGIGAYLLPLALTMALSCFCSVLCGVLSGVGRQRAVALVSLIGSGIQLAFTLLLIPRAGMGGYAAGALVCALVECALCLRLVVEHTGLRVRIFDWLTAPGLAALLAGLTANLLLHHLKDSGLGVVPAGLATLVFALVLYLAALHTQGVSLAEALGRKE